MFFDNASTTKIDKDILKYFDSINDDFYYNPGALYYTGRNVRKRIDTYREKILKNLNGTGKIVFTGSATEANNLALLGVVKRNFRKILVSMGEHPSVYNTALELIQRGYNVEFVPLNKYGVVDIKVFEKYMTPDVDFISIMHVSNETGAVNDIANLVYVAKSINPNVIFHSDGVQAVGKINVDIDDIDVDMYTMSAHKIHGMKGVGALFVKNNIKLKPIIFGGGQESGLRSGTENILGIFSLNVAVENSIKNLDNNYSFVKLLKDKFLSELQRSNLIYSLNSFEGNSPYIISISFDGCRSETLLNMLNDKGVFVGNGSACSSKNSGNRILDSMGVSKTDIEGNLRISFSKYNTLEEVYTMSKILIETVDEYLHKVR